MCISGIIEAQQVGNARKWLIDTVELDKFDPSKSHQSAYSKFENGVKPTIESKETESSIIEGKIEVSPLQFISIYNEATSETSCAVFLTVENISNKTIPKVYGKLIDSKSVRDDNRRYSPVEMITPKQSNFGWRGGGFCKDLPAKRTRDIIIAERLFKYPGLNIFFKTNDGEKAIKLIGALILDIEIGSEAIDIPLQIAQIKLQWNSGELKGEIVTSLPTDEKLWQMNLVKLFHDGQDALADLEKAQNMSTHKNPQMQVAAEVRFTAWINEVVQTLENTRFIKTWYHSKVVDYRQDSLSEYISASKRALGRLESIVQSATHV